MALNHKIPLVYPFPLLTGSFSIQNVDIGWDYFDNKTTDSGKYGMVIDDFVFHIFFGSIP